MQAYVLNPSHQNGVFRRTIRIEGREARLVTFELGGFETLDRKEVAFLADEIRRGIIGKAGDKFPKPAKPVAAKRHPCEEDPEEPEDPRDADTRHGWL